MGQVAAGMSEEAVGKSVYIMWLGQAGFVFTTPAGKVIYIDPYLSDAVEREVGFRRLLPPPIRAEDIHRVDWVISSHEHLDHLDTDALPAIARNNPHCLFAGPTSCIVEYDKCGVEADRRLIMEPYRSYTLDSITVHTARADHGELSPLALALLLDFGDVRIMFTGDTALNTDFLSPLIEMKPDVLLSCINGRFGNMGSCEAAELTAIVAPRVVIPCHFHMFKEHNGDPESFVRACAEVCPSIPVRILVPGEGLQVWGNR